MGYTGHSKPEGLVNGHSGVFALLALLTRCLADLFALTAPSDHDSASQQAHEAKQLVAAFVTKLATGELNRDILRRCEVLSAEVSRLKHLSHACVEMACITSFTARRVPLSIYTT